MTRTKRNRSNKRLVTVGGLRVSGSLSAAIRRAVEILSSKKEPPPSKRKKADRSMAIETVIATVLDHGHWYCIVKWKNIDSITLMMENGQIKCTNYINATYLFDLPKVLVTYEAVSIVMGDFFIQLLYIRPNIKELSISWRTHFII